KIIKVKGYGVTEKGGKTPDLIEMGDIKGVIHNHSTYSDGLHTLEEMAEHVRNSGYEYFVISDHSRSAGYAGGLSEERVMMQWREIELLNATYGDQFRVFKGIESDILSDGSLDYPEDILKEFDLVIASVHSILNMDENRATTRLIKAIENPYTRILGHPTGRLLLARPGYPLDFKKIIEACAQNDVALELNANPQRLDMDWTWIPYAMEKDVLISVNPDAHSKGAVHFIRFGVAAARKGGLTIEGCLNSKSLSEFEAWLAR
ncbi:MAG: PHP domain-containing protein, partial [Saprospiraceae bacterium]|nr:PHP domain-containing protein [Saprospiraceae bacterium]